MPAQVFLRNRILFFCGLALFIITPATAFASDELNTGDTAWVMISSALVLFMMIPGLAMFYGGLVRVKNVLSLFMQCFAITALVSVIWTLFGYSVAFSTEGMQAGSKGLHAFLGGFSKVFLWGVTPDHLNGNIPEVVFFVFQMAFAVITPGLIVGAFAERFKFAAVCVFSSLWVILAYLPICHMVWGGPGAFFADLGVVDFAGGIVVHVTAGSSALIAALLAGKRRGYPTTAMPPHNMTMTLTGTGMLWVGWFGFNGGSALAANGTAGMAVVVTQISPCVAALTWMAIEWRRNGKPSALGFATGAIAGLAAITPASGTVGPLGAMAIGLASGLFCYWLTTAVKRRFGYDDALDVVGVHGGGGLIGTLLLSVFASTALGGSKADLHMPAQFLIQAFACAACAVYCMVVTFVLLKAIDAVIGLRVGEEAETIGLDISEHEETGYVL